MNSIKSAEILLKNGMAIDAGDVKGKFKYSGAISYGVQEAKRLGGYYLMGLPCAEIAISGLTMLT